MPSASHSHTRIHLQALQVGQGHRVALATAGDPRLPAVLIVHGGPGGGSRLREPLLFDARRHYLVWVDQRGCARSRPRGSTRRNNTGLLVRDLERVREHLGLSNWSVYGGSWGAALALAYAAAHPTRVRALLLRGSYLTSRRDTARFMLAGRRRAPRAWHSLLHAAGATRADKLLQCCATVSRDGTVAQRRRFGLIWSLFENAMLFGDTRRQKRMSSRKLRELQNRNRIQWHYLSHACWLGRQHLRRCVQALRDAQWPVLAVHGSNDAMCPPGNLRVLRQWLPRLRTRLLDCGHLETEPAMLRALRTGLAELAELAELADQG